MSAPRQSEQTFPVHIAPGAKRHLLDAAPREGEAHYKPGPWYINDHTLVKDLDGVWHVFGIWHPEPADPLDEKFFVHATSPSLEGTSWTVHAPVLPAREEQGETHVWAPHVIRAYGLWWMFYAGGTEDHERYRITVAQSNDLFEWRHPENSVLFEDGYDARDPMVLRVDDEWLMYYTRTSERSGGWHEVAVRRSADLMNWSDPSLAFRSDEKGTVGGPTESPFVISGPNGGYILFICESTEYDRTKAYFSNDPMHFRMSDELAVELDEHCAEIVLDGAKTWITGGGWGRGGLSIRQLMVS